MSTMIRSLLFAGCLALPNLATADQCKINITVKNTGTQPMYVLSASGSASSQSAVKTQLSPWRSLGNGSWGPTGSILVELDGGKHYSDLYTAVLGCKKKRRYKIQYHCRSGKNINSQFNIYYPSSTGWVDKGVTDVTIKLDKCI